MLNMSIFAPCVNDDATKKWERRFEDAKMQVEIHPEFSFSSHSGFLPFKIKVDTSPDNPLYNKVWLSGFEIYIDDYNFEYVKNEAQPKKSFLKSLFKEKEPAFVLVDQEIDSILSNCTKEITLGWGVQDTLEFRMACLSAAIILEIFGGVCYDPQEGQWYKSEGLFEKFINEVNVYEDQLKPREWNLHEFEKWL
jgi:hypothetical protein